MTDFTSLTTVLEGWLDKPLSKLPKAIQERVRQDFFPMLWDGLSAEQRQSVAGQWDYNHDPATEKDRQFWWDFFIKKGELEKQIAEWESVAAPTAGELAQKESRLQKLNDELARMQRHQEQARGDHLPVSVGSATTPPKETGPYIAYPKALRRFEERLNATPDELAAWIFMGPEQGGIAAYRNANELEPPPRFSFAHYRGAEDYLSPMMACWFLEQDVERFNPVDRYITGKALIERWGKQPGIQAEAFILAKIEESRLIDLHPIYGGARGSFSEQATFPPLETGLFVLAHVEAVEAEDFGVTTERGELLKPADMATSRATAADMPVSETRNPCAVFVAMEDLTSDELSIALLGDKVDDGIGANGMLEISARGETRRVPWAVLDLVNRSTGRLNSQGVVLLGLALVKAISGGMANSKKVSRLREAFRKHLGMRDDPFDRPQQGIGWQPRFKVADRRGDADERAKRNAERPRRRLSFDQYPHLQDVGSRQGDIEGDDDEAAEWLRTHDPDYSA